MGGEERANLSEWTFVVRDRLYVFVCKGSEPQWLSI